MPAGPYRNRQVIGAVNIGSFRISAIIAEVTEAGEIRVLGSGNRASSGIRRGYVTDMAGATYAVRDALEKAEKMADTSIEKVWVGASGAGLTSELRPIEIPIGGRRVEREDIEQLLLAAQGTLQSDGRSVLHAQPACYYLDGADGVANPVGLYADRLGVDIHVMLAEGAPMRNIREAVERAHLKVEGVVAAPLATGHACLSEEEQELGVALVELGGEVTNVAVYAGGMLVGLSTIQRGCADVTDAIASAFGIRRFQAERLKCKHGSALASRTDHREMISIAPPSGNAPAAFARGANDRGEVARAELISVITGELDSLMSEVARSLDAMGFNKVGFEKAAPEKIGPEKAGSEKMGASAGAMAKKGPRGRQVVITGGGAELAGLADYAQSVLGVAVRIGRPPALPGLPEAHSTPGFATLAGIVCYAAADPLDIRRIDSRFTTVQRPGPVASLTRIWTAMREFF